MAVKGAFIMPHPPIILPEVGKGEQRKINKTADACREAAKHIAELKPATIVLTSPHSVMYADYFHIYSGRCASGDMSRFNAPNVKMKVEYDEDLASRIGELARRDGIEAGSLGENGGLDHGVLVPLSFVSEVYRDFKLVRIGLSGLTYDEHYKLGQCIAKAAEESGKDVVFLASGDLSHKVSESGPYGFAKAGVEFDRSITKAMDEGDFYRFLSFSPDFAEEAAECGLRSFIVMAGALDAQAVNSELLSYEGTFGVGYGVASFIPTESDESRRFLERYEAERKEKLDAARENEDEYARLARYSVEYFVSNGRRAALPKGVSAKLLNAKAGVFVSLHKDGTLRGCIGTTEPVRNSVAEEIISNGVSACSRDPRFESVREDELDLLNYSVDVLSPSEAIDSKDKLDPKKYGVIVTKGCRRGLLLPDLAGVDTVEKQISIAKQKGGISENETCSLERFTVERHK